MESEWQISFWINECECRWDLSNWIVIWLLFSCLVWFRPSVFLIPKGNIQKCEQLLVLHFLTNVHFPIGLCVYTCEYRYILYGFHKDISEITPVGSLSFLPVHVHAHMFAGKEIGFLRNGFGALLCCSYPNLTEFSWEYYYIKSLDC